MKQDAGALLDSAVERARFSGFPDLDTEDAEFLDEKTGRWEANGPDGTRYIALWLMMDMQTRREFVANLEDHEVIHALGELAAIRVNARQGDRSNDLSARVEVHELDLRVVVDDEAWFAMEVMGRVRPSDVIDLARNIERRLH